MASEAGGPAKPNPKFPNRGSLNPNWAQLQQKLQDGNSFHRRRPNNPSAVVVIPTPASVLGKRKERPNSDDTAPPPSLILAPTSTDCSLTDALAMDCEMVGVSSEGNKSALGRVTIVNTWGNVVYDEYVRPLERIVDYRTRISGIRPKDMRKAKVFWDVQKKVAELIKDRILVGHALHNDLKVLLLSHPKKDMRDTSEYKPLSSVESGRRALKYLAAHILGVSIQQKEHCSIEDARAAMFIYNKHRREWEKSVKNTLKTRKKLKNRRKRKSSEKDASKFDVLTTP